MIDLADSLLVPHDMFFAATTPSGCCDTPGSRKPPSVLQKPECRNSQRALSRRRTCHGVRVRNLQDRSLSSQTTWLPASLWMLRQPQQPSYTNSAMCTMTSLGDLRKGFDRTRP